MKWLDKFKRPVNADEKAGAVSPERDEPRPPENDVIPKPDDSVRVPGGKAETDTVSDDVIAKLSSREAAVFFRLLEGATMREIADELSIKTSTVNGYCGMVYRKLGVNSKVRLILKYSSYRKGNTRKGDGYV